MKITYDKDVDAMYIYLKKGKIAKTLSIEEGNVFADVDKKGGIIGLEILDASRRVSDLKRKTEIIIGKKSVALPAFVS